MANVSNVTPAGVSTIRPSSVPARGMAKRILPHKVLVIFIYM